MSVESAVNQLDRSQRNRLHDLAVALHLSTEFAEVFGELKTAIDVADAQEAYAGQHLQRAVWPELWP